MNTDHTIPLSADVAAAIRTPQWAEVMRHALTIKHLCGLLSEQDELSDPAVALGHAIGVLADHILATARVYVECRMNTAALQDDDWTDVHSRAGNIQELVELLRDQSIGHLAGLALASAMDLLAGHIVVIAEECAP